jgi:hypothetical protein
MNISLEHELFRNYLINCYQCQDRRTRPYYGKDEFRNQAKYSYSKFKFATLYIDLAVPDGSSWHANVVHM